MRALLLLVLAAVPAGAKDKEAARQARAREEARIERRIALKTAFNSAEKLAAGMFEAFALQPIRTWEGVMAAVLKEPSDALRNPIRYYLLDEDREVQAFTCVVIGDAPYHPENEAVLFNLVQKFAERTNRGTVHAIYTDPNRLGESIQARRARDAGSVTFPFLQRLKEMAKAGGGRAITIEDTEMLITEILILSFGEKWRAELESRLDFE